MCFCAVRVCRVCARVIGETGGKKYQSTKHLMSEWCKSHASYPFPSKNKQLVEKQHQDKDKDEDESEGESEDESESEDEEVKI